MTTCPTCGAEATEALHTSPAGVSWMAYQHAPSPLEQLAAWCEKNNADLEFSAARGYTCIVNVFDGDGTYFAADAPTIMEAAAKLLDQLKDKP